MKQHPIIESVRADIDGLDFADDDKRQNAEDSIICTVQTLIDRLVDAADALAAKDAALSEMRAELGRARKALEPFAALDIPAAEKWTCGTFLIEHDDIRAARGASQDEGEER